MSPSITSLKKILLIGRFIILERQENAASHSLFLIDKFILTKDTELMPLLGMAFDVQANKELKILRTRMIFLSLWHIKKA